MNDKQIHHLMVMLVLFLAIPAHGVRPSVVATGEPDDPIQIETAQQLLGIGQNPIFLDKHFILNNDIDMNPNGPGGRIVINSVIGSHDHPFFGGFDGNHHVISNLTIHGKNETECGFTGYLKNIWNDRSSP